MILISSFIGQYLWGSNTRARIEKLRNKSSSKMREETILTDFLSKVSFFPKNFSYFSGFCQFPDYSENPKRFEKGVTKKFQRVVSLSSSCLDKCPLLSPLTFLFLIRVTMVQFGGDFSPYLIFLG